MEARKHGCPVQEVKFPVEECSSAAVHWWADTVMTVETSRGGTCHEIKSCDYMMGLGSLWGLIDFTLVAPPVTCHVSSVCRVETWNNLRRLLLLSCGAHVSIVRVQTSVPGWLLLTPCHLMAGIWPLSDYWPHGHTPVQCSAVRSDWRNGGKVKSTIYNSWKYIILCWPGNVYLPLKHLAWPRSFNMLRLLISFLVKVSSSLVH